MTGGSTPRGRFAPSPTGAMHLGNARTALLAWLDVRHAGGAMVLRLEDLDQARSRPGASAGLLGDLRWLGLDWDEGPDVGGAHAPYVQSQRTARYDAAIDQLLASGAAFLCACSRADVAHAASAPHGIGDEGPRYPGTCRGLDARVVQARAAAAGRLPTVRFRGAAAVDGTGGFFDRVRGVVEPPLSLTLSPLRGERGPEGGDEGGIDDFVIRRADGVAAYQLAVVVDDVAMAITDVVRGDDLLSSTPRQLALFAALGAPPPRFAHVPLVLAPGGERLAKRTRPVSIAELRDRGVAPETIIGALAASAGLALPHERMPARELVASFDLARIPRDPACLDPALLAAAVPPPPASPRRGG